MCGRGVAKGGGGRGRREDGGGRFEGVVWYDLLRRTFWGGRGWEGQGEGG